MFFKEKRLEICQNIWKSCFLRKNDWKFVKTFGNHVFKGKVIGSLICEIKRSVVSRFGVWLDIRGIIIDLGPSY